jgi:uncharacterized membrane protein
MSEHIDTLSELKQKFSIPENVNQVHRNHLTRVDKIALKITNNVGTMGFFLILIGWVMIWILWNLFAPVELRFDPFPAFVLLLFMSNILSVLLIPLILVGQNLQARHAELRSEYDYTINRKAEKEDEVILKRLERQEEMLETQHEHIIKLLTKIESLEKK